MSNVQFNKVITDNFTSITFDGTAYTDLNPRRSYGSTNTTIDIAIVYSADTSVDSIAIPAISQATGLTFDLDFLDSGDLSITTESISQTVETNARDTAHQLLTFDQVDNVRTIEIQITGLSGASSYGGFFPMVEFNTQFTRNFEQGAKFSLATERKIAESEYSSYASTTSRLRYFELPFKLLTEATVSAFHHLDYKAGNMPVLVWLDPSSTSAEKWMIANWNIGQTNIATFNDLQANFTELRAWL